MSAQGEKALILHLVDDDSVDVIAHEGLDPDVLPTEELRPLLVRAVEYYHQSGRTQAPTPMVMEAEFGDLLADLEIDINEAPDASVEWAIDDLKGDFVHRVGNAFLKDFAALLHETPTNERVEVLDTAASELMRITFKLEDRTRSTTLDAGLGESLIALDARANDTGELRGARTGIPQIDEHTFGIHEGELAIVAAGPKVGKSLFCAHIALREWEAGRTVVLFTLENSVEMTIDRLACMANMVDSSQYQRGQVAPERREAIEAWKERVDAAPNKLWIIQPDLGQRTVEHMVRQAALRGADTMIIDQLTFVELPSERKAKNERIGEALHMLKSLISSGRNRMSCIVAHQVNREGVKAAEKADRLEMYHMADSSEVERTADWVFGIYQSLDGRQAQEAKFQILAARRANFRAWAMTWHTGMGMFSVQHEITGD